jgi:hypothetical protein
MKLFRLDGFKKSIALLSRNRTTRLSPGPVWRSSSVPIRLRHSALGVVVNQLLRENVHQPEFDQLLKAIWDLCDSSGTVDEIATVLQASFCTSEVNRCDVMHTLQILADSGLLTSSDNSIHSAERVVDLRDMPILIINSEARPDRREFMQRQMERLDLKFYFINGIDHTSRIIGCARSHLDALNRPLRTPLMILEDDCEFNRSFHYRYVVPQEADALYLGASGWGLPVAGVGASVWNGVRFTRFGSNYLRVLNMLSSHAKIYLSESYRRAVREKATVLCERGEPFDRVLASLHMSHLVLTPNQPVCHQSECFGGGSQYRSTRRSLLKLSPNLPSKRKL